MGDGSRQRYNVRLQPLESLVDSSQVLNFLPVVVCPSFVPDRTATYGTGREGGHTAVTSFAETWIGRLVAAAVFFDSEKFQDLETKELDIFIIQSAIIILKNEKKKNKLEVFKARIS